MSKNSTGSPRLPKVSRQDSAPPRALLMRALEASLGSWRELELKAQDCGRSYQEVHCHYSDKSTKAKANGFAARAMMVYLCSIASKSQKITRSARAAKRSGSKVREIHPKCIREIAAAFVRNFVDQMDQGCMSGACSLRQKCNKTHYANTCTVCIFLHEFAFCNFRTLLMYPKTSPGPGPVPWPWRKKRSQTDAIRFYPHSASDGCSDFKF